jgi:hypothetical protein
VVIAISCLFALGPMLIAVQGLGLGIAAGTKMTGVVL